MGELANKIYEFSCNEKVNEIIKYKNKANIWRIIEYGKKSYETRYSRMLRWLLDPSFSEVQAYQQNACNEK